VTPPAIPPRKSDAAERQLYAHEDRAAMFPVPKTSDFSRPILFYSSPDLFPLFPFLHPIQHPMN